MEATKTQERSQRQQRTEWKEVFLFPKRRLDWQPSDRKRRQDFYNTQKGSRRSSALDNNLSSIIRSSYSKLPSKKPNTELHQRRVFWLLSTQKPKSHLLMTHAFMDARDSIIARRLALLIQQQERVWLDERYALLELRYSAPLSDAKVARLRWIEEKLDELDDQDPVEQEADRRLVQTSNKLDEILSLLRSLPRKSSIQEDAGQ